MIKVRMTIVRRSCALVAALGLALTAAGCGNGDTAPGTESANTIKLGLLAPYSGSVSTLGKAFRDGANLAVKNLEDQGVDVKVELVEGDTQATAEAGVSAVRRLLDRDQVDALAGVYSSTVCEAVFPIVDQADVLFTTGACISIDQEKWGPKDWLYHAAIFDEHSADAAVGLMGDLDPTPRTVAILYADDVLGQGTHEKLMSALPEAGYSVVLEEAFDPTAKDHSAVLNKVRNAEPDVLMAAGYVDQLMLITRQAKEQNVNVPAFLYPASGPADPQFRETLGADAEAVMGVQPWVASAAYPADEKYPELFPSNHSWVEMFEAEYGYEPSFMAPLGYTIVTMYGMAFDEVRSTDVGELGKALSELDLQTPLGPLHYQKYGDVKHQGLMRQVAFQIQDDEVVPLWPEEARPADIAAIYPHPGWR